MLQFSVLHHAGYSCINMLCSSPYHSWYMQYTCQFKHANTHGNIMYVDSPLQFKAGKEGDKQACRCLFSTIVSIVKQGGWEVVTNFCCVYFSVGTRGGLFQCSHPCVWWLDWGAGEADGSGKEGLHSGLAAAKVSPWHPPQTPKFKASWASMLKPPTSYVVPYNYGIL